MKRASLILVMIVLGLSSFAQDSWKIKLNSKQLLSSSVENEAKNKKNVKTTAFDKKGTLDITYKEAKPTSGWKRTLLFFDENDNELLRIDSISSTTKIKNTDLKKLLINKKQLKIYTVSLPTDPNKAAAIRVRRVHLCTLELL